MAILCHPVHRGKFLRLGECSPSPKSTMQPLQSVHRDDRLANLLENLFLNLPQALSPGGEVRDGHSDQLVVEFMEEAMETAVAYM